MKNESTRKVINVDKPNYVPLFEFKELDNAVIRLSLFKASVEFDITGQTVKLGAKTSKGLKEQSEGFTINKNNLDIDLKNSILVPGTVEIDLELKDASGTMTTASFFITVKSKVLNDKAVEGTNEYDTFTKTVAKVEEDYKGLRRIIIDENQAANLQDQVNQTNAQLDTIAHLPSDNDLNSFLNSLPNGSTIKLPNGVYEIDFLKLENKENLIIYGDFFNTKIKFKSLLSPLSAKPYYHNASDFIHILINNCKNIIFKDIAIEGVYSGTETDGYSHGVFINGDSDNIYFLNVGLNNICGEGILHNATGTVYCEKCKLDIIRNSVFGSSNTGKFKGYHNNATNCGIEPNVSGISVNSDWDFRYNHIESRGPGVKLGHTNVQATGKICDNEFVYKNTSIATYENCFTLENADSLEIINNEINGYFFAINAAIWSNGDNLKFNENKIKNCVKVGISSFSNKENVEINDNEIDGGEYGIRLVDGNKNFSIKRNKIKNIANYGIWFNTTDTYAGNNIGCVIDDNIIDNCNTAIRIEGNNYLNEIGEKNKITNCITDVYVELSNTYYNVKGNKNKFKKSNIPTLDTNGDIDGVTKHSPSMNNGDVYYTPITTTDKKYLIFRLDNGYNGQEVDFIAKDNNTVIYVKSTNNNGGNIITKDGADIYTGKDRVYRFKCYEEEGVLTWRLLSIN